MYYIPIKRNKGIISQVFVNQIFRIDIETDSDRVLQDTRSGEYTLLLYPAQSDNPRRDPELIPVRADVVLIWFSDPMSTDGRPWILIGPEASDFLSWQSEKHSDPDDLFPFPVFRDDDPTEA